MMSLEEFIWQSQNGKFHVFNQKTHRTYCGHSYDLALDHWRPRDALPSEEWSPTCKVCLKAWKKTKEKSS